MTRTRTASQSRAPAEFYIDASICMSCGFCAEFCPFDAIKMNHDYELAVYERYPSLVYNMTELTVPVEYYASIWPTQYEEEEQRRAEEEAKKAAKQAAKAKPAAKPAPAAEAKPAPEAKPAVVAAAAAVAAKLLRPRQQLNQLLPRQRKLRRRPLRLPSRR